jgi:tRNA nucleotidyltransferase (CCA-adding enzyme)
VALIWAASTELWRLRRRILLYWTRLFRVEPMLTGRDLLELGLPKGPGVGLALEALRNARLDGEIETREEEIRFVLDRFILAGEAEDP